MKKNDWTLLGKSIKNSLNEVNKLVVMVDIKDIEKLKEHGINYFPFSEEACTTNFIRQGKKHKRFNSEDVKTILEDLKSMSIRNTARKYNCSTSTLYCIKKGTY